MQAQCTSEEKTLVFLWQFKYLDTLASLPVKELTYHDKEFAAR